MVADTMLTGILRLGIEANLKAIYNLDADLLLPD